MGFRFASQGERDAFEAHFGKINAEHIRQNMGHRHCCGEPDPSQSFEVAAREGQKPQIVIIRSGPINPLALLGVQGPAFFNITASVLLSCENALDNGWWPWPYAAAHYAKEHLKQKHFLILVTPWNPLARILVDQAWKTNNGKNLNSLERGNDILSTALKTARERSFVPDEGSIGTLCALVATEIAQRRRRFYAEALGLPVSAGLALPHEKELLLLDPKASLGGSFFDRQGESIFLEGMGRNEGYFLYPHTGCPDARGQMPDPDRHILSYGYTTLGGIIPPIQEAAGLGPFSPWKFFFRIIPEDKPILVTTHSNCGMLRAFIANVRNDASVDPRIFDPLFYTSARRVVEEVLNFADRKCLDDITTEKLVAVRMAQWSAKNVEAGLDREAVPLYLDIETQVYHFVSPYAPLDRLLDTLRPATTARPEPCGQIWTPGEGSPQIERPSLNVIRRIQNSLYAFTPGR